MNTLCFIGVFQALALFLSTKSLLALGIFINGALFHSGYRGLNIFDIMCNFCFMIWMWIVGSFDLYAAACFAVSCAIYKLNEEKKDDLVHVLGVQFTGLFGGLLLLNKYDSPLFFRVRFPGNFTYGEVLIPCVLLGTIIATLLHKKKKQYNIRHEV